jgi:hypothetical protein
MTEVLERPLTPADYALPTPELDGHKATRLDIRFAGSGELQRTSMDDLALLKAARLGLEVRLIVVGEISAKSFRLGKKPSAEDDLASSCTVKVLSVEVGEET